MPTAGFWRLVAWGRTCRWRRRPLRGGHRGFRPARQLPQQRPLVPGGGAIIGLTLAALHPETLSGLIAHEPPAVNVLPPRDPARGFLVEVAALYARRVAPRRW